MWLRGLVTSLTVYEALIISLLQADIIPSSLLQILDQAPGLGAVLLVAYYLMRRQDAMLATQRESLKEIYDAHQRFLDSLLQRIAERQREMQKAIGDVEKQITINTATINEVAQVDSIVRELIARLEKK